jgi:IS5 family transposase
MKQQTLMGFERYAKTTRRAQFLATTVNERLGRSRIKITTGTIVDATIIVAPSSTKNKEGKRDPEMHQTAKGNQWYFGSAT